jgi:hypothetical protein
LDLARAALEKLAKLRAVASRNKASDVVQVW